MDVYVDVLFVVNLVLNYLILLAADKFLKKDTGPLRILAGSGAGALYSVAAVIFSDIDFMYSLIAKILLSLLIVYITFVPGSFKAFLKSLIVFYGVSFLFGGAVLGVMYLNDGSTFIQNGLIYYYWNSSWTMTVFGAVFAGIIIRTLTQLLKINFKKKNFSCIITIQIDNKSASIKSFIDTGNSVKDPFSGKPVIITELDSLKEILSVEFYDLITEISNDNYFNKDISLSEAELYVKYKLRMIPYSVLGKRNCLIPAIVADSIEIEENESIRSVENAVIGLHCGKIQSEGEYSAIVGHDIAFGV